MVNEFNMHKEQQEIDESVRRVFAGRTVEAEKNDVSSILHLSPSKSYQIATTTTAITTAR
jgi:hypothetical protein